MSESVKNKAIYKGTMWSFIDNFFRQGITFVVFIFLARILDPQLFGVLAAAMLFIQAFNSIIFESISTSIIRKKDITNADLNTGFWLCVGISIPSFLILFLSANFIEQLMDINGLSLVIKGTSFILLTSGLSKMHEVWLIKRLNFKALAVRSSISVTLGGAIAIYLALQGYGIESLIAQQLVTILVQLVLLWFLTPWKPKLLISTDSAKEIFSFGKHVAMTGVANFTNNNSDIAFVSYYLGAAATGIYSTAKRIPTTLNTVLTTSLIRISLPAFSSIQDDDERLRATFLESVTLTALFTAPIFFGLATLSEDIVFLMLGKQWSEVIPIMQLITVIGFLPSIGQYNQNIMLIKNKPQWQTRIRVLYAISDFVFFFIFTRFGLLYTAIAFTIRAICLYPIAVWCALQLLQLKWKDYLKAVYPAVLSSILMSSCVYALSILSADLNIVIRLMLCVLLGVLSYLIFSYSFLRGEFKIAYIQQIKNLKLRLTKYLS